MRYRYLAIALALAALVLPSTLAQTGSASSSEGATSAPISDAEFVALRDGFKAQLEADRERLYGFTRQQRNEYMGRFFGDPSRDRRRAFKAALEQFRTEWDFSNVADEPGAATADPNSGRAAAKVAGTNITYDTGNVVVANIGVASQMVGNRFDSALNVPGTACCFPVETSGTITMITFDMVNTFFGSAVWSLYSNIVGTMAVQVTSMARPGIMTGLNTLAVASPTTVNAYANGTFLAGIWQFSPTMTALAFDTATVGGQGHHAISLNDGAAGSMLATVTNGGMNLNAIFRVSGNVAPPVELMDFTLESGDTGESGDSGAGDDGP